MQSVDSRAGSRALWKVFLFRVNIRCPFWLLYRRQAITRSTLGKESVLQNYYQGNLTCAVFQREIRDERLLETQPCTLGVSVWGIRSSNELTNKRDVLR